MNFRIRYLNNNEVIISMNSDNIFRVLLYFDGSQHSFSAAVYTATLVNKIPSMHLTIVQVQERSKEDDYILNKIWSDDPNLYWSKSLLEKVDSNQRSQYSEIISKTSEIFSERGHYVNQQIIFANDNIRDTAEAIIDYATRKECKLIVMGTRGPSSLQGLMHGSLAHKVLNKSDISVLLVKKLPQDFIDRFCSSPSGENTRVKGRRGHLYLAKTM